MNIDESTNWVNKLEIEISIGYSLESISCVDILIQLVKSIREKTLRCPENQTSAQNIVTMDFVSI